MEKEANTAQHKKNDEISNTLHERTYDEIVTENEYLGRRVVELLALVDKMEKEKRKMEELSDLDEGWISDLITERDEQCESNKRCMKQLEECRQKIKEMEDERALAELQSGTTEASDRSTSDASERENSVMENEDNDATLTPKDANTATKKDKDGSQHDTHLVNKDSGIDIDFGVITREIKNQVNTMIDEKLNILGIKTNKYHTPPKYDNAERRTGENLRVNIENTRELNVIIHGIDESNKVDDILMNTLFGILDMNNTGSTIAHRLGEKKQDQPRPVKIVMESKNQKAEFMSKLWKLKYSDNIYKKIRVTDDYTWEERQEIRRWVNMANDRNEKDNEDNKGRTKNYTWKVRGTPKTGMRIIQVRIQ